MKLGDFSYFTLLPNDPDERRQHWQYKLGGIRKTMFFYGIALLAITFFSTIFFLFGRSINELGILVTCIFAGTLFSLIYIFSKKSDLFVYAIPLSRLIIHGAYLYLTRESVKEDIECSYSSLFIFLLDELYFTMAYLFDIVFLSPGIKITLLTYTPTFIGVHICQVLMRYESFDLLSAGIKSSLVAISISLSFLIYYLLNLQDLIRFQEH